VTRPYYVSTATFVVKNESKLAGSDRRSLAGMRIGALRNSAHQAFLKTYFSKFALQEYDSEAQMLHDMKAGNVNAAFGDMLHFAFWLKGADAAACCKILSAPFVDTATVSRGAAFAAARDRSALIDAFDASLDSLEASGATAEVFARYVPAPLW
jgi:polar amino acid transport system substrate-binding protein